jgi:TolB protein
MNADGSAPVRITTPAPANDISPAWSSLGTIAFERSQAEGSAPPIGDIYLVNPDGSGLTNLTSSPAEYHTPAWSPDGTRLAFAEILPDPTVQNSEIFAINSDGSGRVNLTNHPAYDFDPSWSADGGSIVFTSGRVTSPYNYDIINMEIDGSHQRNLTRKSLADDVTPEWGP